MATRKYSAVPIDYLRETFDYDYKTGVLYRNSTNSPCSTIPASNGQVYVNICGIAFPQHRVAWAILTGGWPKRRVIHLNGIASDNRLLNLSLVGDPSGFSGPAFYRNRWRVFLRLNNWYRCMGPFQNINDARSAYWASLPHAA